VACHRVRVDSIGAVTWRRYPGRPGPNILTARNLAVRGRADTDSAGAGEPIAVLPVRTPTDPAIGQRRKIAASVRLSGIAPGSTL
jgi:hypothetical protein